MTERLYSALGYNDVPLALEAKLRRAMRAARFEETPPAVWLKVLPTIPEGVSTTQAEEMFDWARSLILDTERSKGIAEMQARRNTAQQLLSAHDF
jgi:hypothetical protein